MFYKAVFQIFCEEIICQSQVRTAHLYGVCSLNCQDLVALTKSTNSLESAKGSFSSGF